MAEEEAGPSGRESYGWLSTSAVPAKKRRVIDGVGDTGVVELQAQLYRTQQQVAAWKDSGLDPGDKHVRRKAGVDVAQIMGRRNAGVEARAAADKLQLKHTGEGAERLSESAAALERKAALYEKLARGDADDEQGLYEVDFVSKGLLQDEARASRDWLAERDEARRAAAEGASSGGGGGRGGYAPDTAGAALGGGGGMQSADMLREQERRRWEEQQAAEAAERARRAARREAVLGLSAATEAGRERAAEERTARDAALAAKRSKLKAAFLQAQVAKAAALAAAGKKGGGGGGGKG